MIYTRAGQEVDHGPPVGYQAILGWMPELRKKCHSRHHIMPGPSD